MNNQNWEIKTLGEVCDLITGGTPSRSHPEYFNNGTIKWLVSGDIHKKEIFDCDGRITENGHINSSTRFLPLNSVMIALNGQGKTRGTVALLRTKAMCNQSLVSISPKDTNALSSEYLYRVLDGRYAELRKMTGDAGNERRGLNMPLIRSVPITVPPLIEQKRIVKILDEKFRAIEKLKIIAKEQLDSAKELFENSVFDVFTKPKVGWVTSTLSEVCEKITDGTHQTPKYYDEGIVFLSSRNVTSRKIDWENIKYIDNVQHEAMHKRVAPRMGDILLAKNGTTGVAAKVDRDTVFDIYVSLAHLRPLNFMDGYFLLYFINSLVAKKQFNKRLKGMGVPNLHLNEIREVVIPYPKLKLDQEAVVKDLDELSDKTKELEAIFQRKIAELEELKKSYLHEAFSGKL